MRLEEVIRELRALNTPVPKPMRLPTPDEVDDAQHQLGVAFHPDYRKYLLEASDVVYGHLEPCVVAPGGRGDTDLVTVCREAWNAGVPLLADSIPICMDNGDYFCMNRAGEIAYWSFDGATDERWPDLATWIKKVWIEES